MRRRIWIIVVLIFLILASIVASELYMWFVPNHLNRSYLWSSTKGIHHRGQSGKLVLYRLPAKELGFIEYPLFSKSKDLLVYCSEDEKYLAIARAGEKVLFINLPKEFIEQKWTTFDISTDGSFVLLSIVSNRKPSAVMIYDIRNCKWRKIENTVRAILDPSGSGLMAKQNITGAIIVTDAKHPKYDITVGHVINTFWPRSWSYDFANNTLFLIKSGKEIYVKPINDKIRIFKLPRKYSAFGVIYMNSLNELWVPAIGPFSQTGVAIFSAEGVYLGADDNNNIGPDISIDVADWKDVQLLSMLHR